MGLVTALLGFLAEVGFAGRDERTPAQCIACHGAGGEGGVGPKLAGQSVEDITSKLSTYRDGGTLGSQSALMWSVAKPMSDKDIRNLAEFVKTL